MTMDSKSILLSNSFWGMIVALLAPLAAMKGYTIDQAGAVNAIIGVLGGVWSIWGILRSTTTKYIIRPKL